MTEFNGFKGAAVRLDDIDIPRIGSEIGVGEDEIHAFMDVEAAGSGFDSQGRPKILFEPHVLFRNLSGKKRDEAVKQGLAYATWGEKPYPKDSYPRLIKAMAIDETAALKATSWGLTQILGENCKGAGYATPQAMVLAFMADEENHLAATVSLLKHMGIADDLKAHAWAVVARVWNGPGYRKNEYDIKMAEAYAKWAKIKDTPWSPPAGLEPPVVAVVDLYDGKEHDELRSIQAQLDTLLYHDVGTIDGKWGRRTRDMVKAFRADNGLPEVEETASIDKDFLSALALGRQRPIAPARANATVSDLRAKDDAAIRKSDKTKVALGAMGALVAVPEGIDKGLAAVETYTGYMQRVRALIDPVVSFVTDNAWLIVGAGAAYGIYKLWDLDVLRLKKHQTGGDVTQ